MEEWKVYKITHKGLKNEKIYEISNYGNVKVNGNIINIESDDKYLGIAGHYRIHRMVAETFIPNPDNKPCVDHIDGNSHNNRADNLRWTTYKENINNPVTKQRQILSWTEERKTKASEYFKNSETFKDKMKEVMSDNEIRKQISNTLLERYKNDDELHNLISKRTKEALNKPETLSKLSENSKKRCWVHNDNDEKFIVKTELEEYLSRGWKPKRHPNQSKKQSQTIRNKYHADN